MDNKRYTKEYLIELWEQMDYRGRFEIITAAEIILDFMRRFPECKNTASD